MVDMADATGRGAPPAAAPPDAQRKPSLRTELLFNLAFLAAGALLLGVMTAMAAPLLLSSSDGALMMAALVGLDLAIFILFGRYLVTRHVTRPLDALVHATDEVAGGRLESRAPEAPTRELDALAASVNRMTERLLDAQGALVRAEKLASIGRLAAGVAHEIGNPLAAAGNYAEMLGRRGADLEALEALRCELARIDAIVRSLLDYARPTAARRQDADLGDVARGAVALLERQGVFKRVRVDAAGLGPAPVTGDPAALEQVCVNLLLNAVHAAGEGGSVTVNSAVVDLGDAAAPRVADPSGAAHRRTAEAPRFLGGAHRAAQLVVGDSGPGVPEEDRARIFDPFVTSKPPGEGTGLGLAVVQRVVHDHQGRVDIRAAREGGAAFVVTLPLRA